MAGTNLIPEKIKSPFQLMAAWFAMLVLLVSALLTGAANISHPSWAAGFLIGFTAILILLVLAFVTLMLTKFRPHLQDGKEYSQWLKDQNAYTSSESRQTSSQLQPKTPAPSSSRGRLHRRSPHSDNKHFLINLSDVPYAPKLRKKLQQNGFNVEIYQPPSILLKGNEHDIDEHEAIWVGCMLPARETIEAIKIAIDDWSHLKYLHLSNDGETPPDEIHYQLYFGGSSMTARHDYKLTAWTSKELKNLNESMTTEDFHALIRSKYPESD